MEQTQVFLHIQFTFPWQSTERRDICAAIAKANKECILDKTKPCLQRDLSWSDVYLQAYSEAMNVLEPVLPWVPHCSCVVLNDGWIQGCCCPPCAHLCLLIANASWYWGDWSSVTVLSSFCNKGIKNSFKSVSLHWFLKVLVSVWNLSTVVCCTQSSQPNLSYCLQRGLRPQEVLFPTPVLLNLESSTPLIQTDNAKKD